MANADVIAEREVTCIFPDGRCETIHLQIGRPQPAPDQDWTCTAAAEELLPEIRVYGVDSWQALTLAIGLMENVLAEEVRKGAVLHWPDDGTAVQMTDLFAHKLRHGAD